MSNGGMIADDKFWPPIFFLREMPRWPERKTGDPIAAPDRGVGLEMQEIDIFANGEMTDVAAFLHN